MPDDGDTGGEAGAGVLVITGAMAAGKSTVAQAVAERLPLAAHMHGDLFRRLVVSGRASTDPPLSPAAAAQLHLRHRIAARVADEYAAAGITAVVQDLYLGADLLPFLQRLRARPLRLVVLAPSAAVLAARDTARGSTGFGVGTVYRHFPSRQALLENLAAPSLTSLVDTARDAAQDPDPGSGLHLLLGAALRAQLDDPVLAAVLATADPVCPETLLLSTDFGRHVHQLLDNARRVSVARGDVTPDDLRRLLCGVVVAVQAGADPTPRRTATSGSSSPPCSPPTPRTQR